MDNWLIAIFSCGFISPDNKTPCWREVLRVRSDSLLVFFHPSSDHRTGGAQAGTKVLFRLHQDRSFSSLIKGINNAMTMKPTISPRITTINGSSRLTRPSTSTPTSSSKTSDTL